jgi:hypothetical protein
LELFLDTFSDSIRARVIVIGSSDRNFHDFHFEFPKTVHTVLCQNNASIKDRVLTLPLGLENRELGRAGLKRFHRLNKDPKICNRVFVPPMSPTNPVRRKTILECLEIPNIFDVQVQLLEERTYFEIAKKYRFVLCLEGNGFENHRIWETLYRGGLPILLRTNWSKTLAYLNLPIILVDSIREINEEFLLLKDLEFASFSPNECPQLWTPYWKSVISRKFSETVR